MPDVQPIAKRRPKKKFASTKQNKEVADRLWSKIVRARGRCELQPIYGTPCVGNLEACHIVPRKWSATRTIEENGISACGFHHRSCFDAFPGDQARVVDSLYGSGTYDYLRAIAAAGIRNTDMTPLAYWRQERSRLTRLWDQIQEQTP